MHSEEGRIRIALKARCSHFAFPDFFKANLSVGLGSTVYGDQLCRSNSLTERNLLLAFPRSHHSHFPDSSQLTATRNGSAQQHGSVHTRSERTQASESLQPALGTNKHLAFYPAWLGTHGFGDRDG